MYRDGFPVSRQSPILVVIVPDVEQLCSARPTLTITPHSQVVIVFSRGGVRNLCPKIARDKKLLIKSAVMTPLPPVSVRSKKQMDELLNLKQGR